ncbi:Cytochrome b-c1 complex subunit 2-like, partial [Homarus americanus]
NRGFAAQAAAQQSSYTLPQHNSKVTTLPSGTVVASLENNAPVSHVALLFKAGSRYESASNQGAAHMLRACAGLATNNTTSFAITRTIQQAGGSLSAESGREHILYGLDVIRDNLDAGLEILREVGTQPAFKPWEIKSCVGRIKNELALRDPSIIAVELLHSAAFRNTVAMAVVGLGVDLRCCLCQWSQCTLMEKKLELLLWWGEIRQENGASVMVAVASAGASLAVAQQILGVGRALSMEAMQCTV